MSRNRRDRRDPNRLVVHITARIFEGLPFVPRRTITRTIKGILARGQLLFPVTICAFCFMGNHHHLLLAGDGNRISPFMNFVQAELAKAFKCFIPFKYQDKFWAERFHEQRLVTEHDVIEKLLYLYLNPVEAAMVSCPEDYLELCSIKTFLTGAPSEELCSYIPSRHLRALHNTYSPSKDREEEKHLVQHIESFSVLRVDPLGWLKCFNLQQKRTAIQEQLLKTLSELTIKARKQFVLGLERVRSQPLARSHRPPKNQRTPYIICYDSVLRKAAIASYREFNHRCREAWKALKQGIVQVLWPIGAYKPYHGWGPLRA